MLLAVSMIKLRVIVLLLVLDYAILLVAVAVQAVVVVVLVAQAVAVVVPIAQVAVQEGVLDIVLILALIYVEGSVLHA